MVFAKQLRDRVRRGEITCSVRIWTHAHVKVGGRYPLGGGAIVVDSITQIRSRDITAELARESGFASRAALLKVAKHGRGENIYLVRFHYVDAIDTFFRVKPFKVKPRKTIPHEFVLEALAAASPTTNPMFGCLAVYVGDKIVLILRDKPKGKDTDNGVWLATTQEHHKSLRREFPSMRSITVFGENTGWQVLPADAPDFEESAMRACELILAGDPRIGKVPKSRKR